ncbi:hypothetical protein O181_097625 [Austropuccinia psidii MF-1]|uniref:Tet-like 2OG-Fe(II) oxygenase domain-containing protein n=1 Tax=Austropuccinia psidii MF-1 TaxID=1389203 RepID=A0A9Q3J7S4_9BASI|nr:hypothetical protein [Austropuccinia psidii MF-1]
MVRTKPDSAHYQDYLNDVESTILPLDVMFRTKPNIKHHEDNNTKSNYKIKLTQIHRQHIHDSKQILSHLSHSKTEYKTFSTISIEKKSVNASWLKLPSLKALPHPYVLNDKTKKPFLPVIIYEITPFDNSSGHSQLLQKLIMTLMSLSQNLQEIKTNKQLIGGIMKGIGFCPGSDSGNYAAANENKSLMEEAKLPNFSQLKWTSANQKEEFKSFTNVIVTQDGFFNKPHQDLNNLNAWTYGIFPFVSKKDFHPLPTVFTPSGHGLHFP